MSSDHTRTIAEFAATSGPEDVPAEIRRQGVRSLVNWIGNPIGACRLETVERVLAAHGEYSSPGEVRLLGRGDRVDLLGAAFINCAASSIYDFDDAHLATVIHPTGPVASALLALSERHAISGAQLVLGLVLGIEVQCRLANALAVAPAAIDEGWFLTGITGPVGTAVAVGRVLGLDRDEIAAAIGIAATRASGTRETHGTMAKNLIPAWGSPAGLQAAYLARAGVTAPEHPLEGARGLGALYAESVNLAALIDGLGTRWDLLDNAFKPYPSGIVTHGAITAAEELVRTGALEVAAIDRVELTVHPQCLALTGLRAPRDAAEGTFSVYHWVALALLHGRARVSEFDDRAVADPSVIALRDSISASADASFSKDEAELRVTLRDGRTISHRVDHALGSKERPLSEDALETKLHDLADAEIGVEAVDRLARSCWGIEELPSAAAIVSAACGVDATGPSTPRPR